MKTTALRSSYGYDTLNGRYSDYYHNAKRARKDYAKQFIYEKNFESIVGLFELSSFSPPVLTQKKINVQELPFGAGIFQTMMKKGFPFLSETRQYGSLKHQVKVYRGRVGKSSVQTNLHFLNGRLLYAHLCFTKTDIPFQNLILSSLEEKYRCQLSAQQSFIINDWLGNCIKGSCGQELNLYYLTGYEQQLQEIKDEQSRRSFIKNQIQVELVNRLKNVI